MRKGTIRDQQLATLIAEEVEAALYMADDYRVSALTVSRVESVTGGRHFTIYIVPEESSSEVQPMEDIKILLDRAAPYLRSATVETLNLKRAPGMRFMVDPLYSPARRLSQEH